MRFPVVLGIAVLSGAVTTFTWARQQSGDQRGSHRPVKPESRAQLIELRAALDLLELEHDAEKAHLLGRMQSMLELEAMSPTQLVEATEIAMSVDSEAQEREWEREKARNKKIEALKTVEEFEKASPQINREREEARKRDVDDTIKKKVSSAKAYLDRRKAEYLRYARELAEKRLELAAAEKRYSDAR
jgi:hypothetical protein